MGVSGKTVPGGGTACAKSLRQESARLVGGNLRRPMWPEPGKRGKEMGAVRPAGPCGLEEAFGFYLEGGGSHRVFWRKEG